MKKYAKPTLITLLIVLIAVQFFHPERNLSNNRKNDISVGLKLPDSVAAILKTSCYDCHSNYTNYPWYANIQPVAWWLNNHIEEGKGEINFNEFNAYRPYRKYKKFKEITEQMDEKEMPLFSYTIIHRNALLNDRQRTLLTNWANAMRDSLKASYPADSLKRPAQRQKES